MKTHHLMCALYFMLSLGLVWQPDFGGGHYRHTTFVRAAIADCTINKDC